MGIFVGYIFLGFVISQITEIVKKAFTCYKAKEFYVPLVLGLVIAFTSKLMLCNFVLSYLELHMSVNAIADMFITGLLLSQGANGIYEIIDFVGNLKEGAKNKQKGGE